MSEGSAAPWGHSGREGGNFPLRLCHLLAGGRAATDAGTEQECTAPGLGGTHKALTGHPKNPAHPRGHFCPSPAEEDPPHCPFNLRGDTCSVGSAQGRGFVSLCLSRVGYWTWIHLSLLPAASQALPDPCEIQNLLLHGRARVRKGQTLSVTSQTSTAHPLQFPSSCLGSEVKKKKKILFFIFFSSLLFFFFNAPDFILISPGAEHDLGPPALPAVPIPGCAEALGGRWSPLVFLGIMGGEAGTDEL